MPKFKYNEPYYTLEFSEIDDGVLKVLSLEGEEEISHLYEFRFELLSEQPDVDADKILNKKASLILSLGEEEPLKIHGIIRRFEQRGRGPDYISYSAVLVPRFWWTTLNHQSQIFQEMNVEDIVTQVMEDAGFSSADFGFQLNESYPASDFVVQYRETDFNFINRWLEHYGIFYYFKQADDKEKIVFADANDAFPVMKGPEEILYNPNHDPLSEQDTISEIVYQGSVDIGSSRLKDYNYEYPNKQMVVESSLNGDYPGTFYDYGDHFKDESAGNLLVNVRNEQQLSQTKFYRGMGDCRAFAPGHKFTLAKHYRDDWNAEYILTRVEHLGTQRGLFSYLGPGEARLPTYQNYFNAIPADTPYRPARRTPHPKIYGLMNAKIDDASDGQYAELNDKGMYKVILPFDLSGKKDGEASRYIRLAQTYSGPGYGIHFPLHKGAEVLLAFIDGNPNRPIIVGAPTNPANTTPVTSANKTQSVIRTAGENELTFDDKQGNENIFLHGTKDWTIDIVNDKNQSVGNNETLDVKTNRDKTVGGNQSESVDGNKTVTVKGNHTESITGNMSQSISAAKNETISQAKVLTMGAAYQVTVGAAMNETVGAVKAEEIGGAKTVAVGAMSSEDVNADKSVKAGGNISENAGKSISQEAGDDFAMQSGKKMGLNAGDDFSVSGGKKGVIDIKDELTIQCGKATIQMKKNGDISINGKKINVKGSGNIVMKAKKILQN